MATLRRRSVLLGSAAVMGSPALVQAQNVGDWPKGPVRIIVPFPPGGSTDPVARIIQAKLIENTGWNIVVENKPGGSGVVGASVAAKSAPDGNHPNKPPIKAPAVNPIAASAEVVLANKRPN